MSNITAVFVRPLKSSGGKGQKMTLHERFLEVQITDCAIGGYFTPFNTNTEMVNVQNPDLQRI